MGTDIGVDPSSNKLAAVITDEHGDFYLRTRIMPKDIVKRCATAYRWMRQLVKEFEGPVSVSIEQPFFNPRIGANAVLPMSKVHGALLAGAIVGGAVLVIPVSPAMWKKKIVGHGMADKSKIAAHVRVAWNRLYEAANGDQDLMDAACINRYIVEVQRLSKAMQREDGWTEESSKPLRRSGKKRQRTQKSGAATNSRSTKSALVSSGKSLRRMTLR